MFVQIHSLTGYPASLINRDDTGLAKKISLGGAMRTRISSQCLKYHWRKHKDAFALSKIAPTSARSRALFRVCLAEPLIERGFDPLMVVTILAAFQDELYFHKKDENAEEGDDQPKKPRSRAKKKFDPSDLDTLLSALDRKEIIILGQAEIDYLMKLAEQVAALSTTPEDAAAYAKDLIKEQKLNLTQMARDAGLDVALFGRMNPGDSKAEIRAAVAVANSITTHRQESETDFFASVDDLLQGAAHMGDSELSSGIFYGYVAIDVDQLLANVGGDAEMAAATAETLIHLVADVAPDGKRAATGSFVQADFVMVEIGDGQPCNLVNAFHRPVRPDWKASVDAMAAYIEKREKMRGFKGERHVASMVDDAEIPGARTGSLDDIARAAHDAVLAAKAGK